MLKGNTQSASRALTLPSIATVVVAKALKRHSTTKKTQAIKTW